MKFTWETLVAAILVAASILFIGRYQISAIGYLSPIGGAQVVYRLDRWTGKIDTCTQSQDSIECPVVAPSVQSAK